MLLFVIWIYTHPCILSAKSMIAGHWDPTWDRLARCEKNQKIRGISTQKGSTHATCKALQNSSETKRIAIKVCKLFWLLYFACSGFSRFSRCMFFRFLFCFWLVAFCFALGHLVFVFAFSLDCICLLLQLWKSVLLEKTEHVECNNFGVVVRKTSPKRGKSSEHFFTIRPFSIFLCHQAVVPAACMP